MLYKNAECTEARDCARAQENSSSELSCLCSIKKAACSLRQRILAYSLAVCLGIAFVVTMVALDLRQAALDHAQADAANLSGAFEEQVRHILGSAANAMDLMKRRIEAQQGEALELPELTRLTPEFAASTIQVAVIGADGRLRAVASGRPPAGTDLSGWEPFAVHRHNPGAGLHIGKPVKGPLSERVTIQLSQRLEKAGGGFAGVLVFSLDPDLLTALHRNADLGATGMMTLVGTDGIVRARYSGAANAPVPAGASLAGAKSLADSAKAERGAYIGTSVIDGATRIFDWRKVSGYPLLAIVGFGRDEVMAEANRHAFIVLGLGFIAIFLTALMAAMIVREVSQRVHHEIALQEESHKLSLANKNLERQHAALLAASTELAVERVNLEKTNAGLSAGTTALGSGEPGQNGVPRQYEPRAAHAAQCDHRVFRNYPRQDVRAGVRLPISITPATSTMRACTFSTSSTTSSTSQRSSRERSSCPRRRTA